MEIAINYFGPQHEKLLHYSKELGIRHAVCTVPAVSNQPAFTAPWHKMSIKNQQLHMAAFGLDIAVLEGIKFIDAAKLGLEDRDLCIAQFCELLQNMSELGIHTVCYNWMPVWGWFRSRYSVPVRGGALATGFRSSDVADMPPSSAGCVSADQLWTNLEYFMKKVVPVAEKYKVQLALHPDDPPVKEIAGVERILISADAMMDAINLVPSEYNGITLCQGTFATMGENVPETIRRFSDRVFFAHLRDIKGKSDDFVECFPDEGITDMVETFKSYKAIGFNGVIRPDHTPTFYGESNTNPGYAVLGNLYSIGFLRGLMKCVDSLPNDESGF